MSLESKEMNCIVCPLGCKLTVQLESGKVLSVTGNTCPRGEKYANEELTAPTRMLTSTVKITNAILPLLPVVSEKPLPKNKVLDCAIKLRNITVNTPIKQGDVIVANILNSGVNIVASRSMEKIKEQA